MAVIYKITNTINNKSYVGFTTQEPEKRINEHLELKSRCPRLVSAVKKYGKEHFSYEILHAGEDLELLNYWENFYILQYNTLHPMGYNLTLGGEGSLNRIYANPEKTKEKMSTSAIKRWQKLSFEEREAWIKNSIKNNDYANSPRSEDVKIKMGISRKKYLETLSFEEKQRQIQKRIKTSKELESHNQQSIEKRFKQPNIKPCEVFGVVYPSLKDAAKKLKISSQKIKKHCIFITKEEYCDRSKGT